MCIFKNENYNFEGGEKVLTFEEILDILTYRRNMFNYSLEILQQTFSIINH